MSAAINTVFIDSIPPRPQLTCSTYNLIVQLAHVTTGSYLIKLYHLDCPVNVKPGPCVYQSQLYVHVCTLAFFACFHLNFSQLKFCIVLKIDLLLLEWELLMLHPLSCGDLMYCGSVHVKLSNSLNDGNTIYQLTSMPSHY